MQLEYEERGCLDTPEKDHLFGAIYVRQTDPSPIDLLSCQLEINVETSLRSALNFRPPSVWKVNTKISLYACHYDASALFEGLSHVAERMRRQIDRWRQHHHADGHPLPCIYMTHQFKYHTGQKNLSFGELPVFSKGGKPESFSKPSVIQEWAFNLEHTRIKGFKSKTTKDLQEQLNLMFEVTASDHQRFRLIANSSGSRERRSFTLEFNDWKSYTNPDGVDQLARVSKRKKACIVIERNALYQWVLDGADLPSQLDTKRAAVEILLRFFKLSALDGYKCRNKVFLPYTVGPGFFPLSQALDCRGGLNSQKLSLSTILGEICTVETETIQTGRISTAVLVLHPHDRSNS